MNQKQALLSYLKNHKGGITQFTAVMELGILRLSERIRELENDGIKIIRVKMHAVGRYGHAVHPTKYKLA